MRVYWLKGSAPSIRPWCDEAVGCIHASPRREFVGVQTVLINGSFSRSDGVESRAVLSEIHRRWSWPHSSQPTKASRHTGVHEKKAFIPTCTDERTKPAFVPDPLPASCALPSEARPFVPNVECPAAQAMSVCTSASGGGLIGLGDIQRLQAFSWVPTSFGSTVELECWEIEVGYAIPREPMQFFESRDSLKRRWPIEKRGLEFERRAMKRRRFVVRFWTWNLRPGRKALTSTDWPVLNARSQRTDHPSSPSRKTLSTEKKNRSRVPVRDHPPSPIDEMCWNLCAGCRDLSSQYTATL
ncbi:hypothetical protein DFP72DRAFT_1060607 [Ephemerocybe angulata]|uniref:Uncharacterized protein n=1 Tax=Ephemerocybe angulata TaxID=980116 RepID=A0A8H6IFE7_9AGAR|nr:hypothetical protein DFP72DRAFT_1060607 [Tulosesus angulatus]